MQAGGGKALHVAEAGFGHGEGVRAGADAFRCIVSTPAADRVPCAGGATARRRMAYFICTLPLTVAVTVALPASTGSASSALARMAWARITGCAMTMPGSVLTVTSRTV